MKKFLFVLTMLITFGCSSDKVVLNDHLDRIVDLERRADLNDQLNLLQDQRLTALENALEQEVLVRESADIQLSDSLQAEMDARIAQDSVLADLIQQESDAREAGDDDLRTDLQLEIAARIAGDQAVSSALALSVLTQTLVNVAVQIQLSQVNSKISIINNKLAILTNRVNNLEDRLDDVEDDVSQLYFDLAAVNASLQGQINSLSIQQIATQAQLDREGVKLYKCNNPGSSERIMKINGYFYAVMNRVTSESVKVITGSSSQTFTTPDMCETWNGDLKLPNSGGQCTPNGGPFASTLISGEQIVVPSYTTKNVTVVKSVEIALDLLKDGSYITTDGAVNCPFSILGDGTSSTGLIPVQGAQ
jgi:hypothetical protein